MNLKINMRFYDRMFRYGLGILLLTWAVAGGPLWAFLGILPLASAAWGFCPVYYIIQATQDKEDS